MEQVTLPAGTYVVAVSGGVDSVALLHALVQSQTDTDHRFVVAHFDHGIRPDSDEDRLLVARLAQHYGLPFVYERGRLGAGASEAVARTARYTFLHTVRKKTGARAIITAHHQDDVIETAVLNMLRGTKSRGLHALRSTEHVHRPLLHVTKKTIRSYAQQQGLVWREDCTNTDLAYTRNYVRAKLLADLGKTHRSRLLRHITHAAEINREIDAIILQYLHIQPDTTALDRNSFIKLPHVVAREIMAQWLRLRKTNVELSRRLLDRLVVRAKTGKNGSHVDIAGGYYLQLSAESIVLKNQAT